MGECEDQTGRAEPCTFKGKVIFAGWGTWACPCAFSTADCEEAEGRERTLEIPSEAGPGRDLPEE